MNTIQDVKVIVHKLDGAPLNDNHTEKALRYRSIQHTLSRYLFYLHTQYRLIRWRSH